MLPIAIPGYEITEVIREGLNTVIYRGMSNQQQVILKVLKAEYPSLEQITRLKHEYKVTENLDLDGVVKVYGLETYQNRLILVAEDFGGISLKEFLTSYKSEKTSLIIFLSIAVQLAQGLVSLHKNQIIHKDIKPANIIINPQTRQVKLTDFSIASRLSQETACLTNPNQLEGTLAYASPEQTGRMNRSVDFRSDFYSLGVTFYEMLTGQLPFISNDPLELVHCHLAKQPTPIQELNLEVPTVLVEIVSKLMEKNAEDRYQSAEGLLADLQQCLLELKQGKITCFIPGEYDKASRLLISQKLYGREKQVEILLEAFERVSNGKFELVVVGGYSGIGKTALINEILRGLTHRKGYFACGKFDQFQRNVPLAASIQAHRDLIRQLLTESEEHLQYWREKFIAASGANAQLIINIIPELELIIGAQPPVVELGAIETANRLNQTFQQFSQVFQSSNHPVVLFLDDLQWADIASLQALQTFMSDSTNSYCLVIAAYRDNEVSSTHPFMQTVEAIRHTKAKISEIKLTPLLLDDVTQLVADTLRASIDVTSLASLLFEKTQGNPFFLTQLLKSLYDSGLLWFKTPLSSPLQGGQRGVWQWDLEKIHKLGATDNVVELMINKIHKLAAPTQKILQLAACIGNKFDLETLATVAQQSYSSVAEDLWSALTVGLIVPVGNNYRLPQVFGAQEIAEVIQAKNIEYSFLHDRVQQAAYALITEDQKQATHLKIGRLLLQKFFIVSSTEELEAQVFNIVNHLNIGIDLILESSEKTELVKLNLIAVQKAKASAAYDAALKYCCTSLSLLSDESWQTNYDLTLALHEKATEAAYFCREFEQMQKFGEIVKQNAQTTLDKVKVYYFYILAYIAQKQLPESIAIGLEILELLGMLFPNSPTEADIQQALTETILLAPKSGIASLIDLPLMTNPKSLAILQILDAISSTTYFLNPPLYTLTTLAMVKLSMHDGNTPLSPVIYSQYGCILNAIINDIESTYQLGNLALNLLNTLADQTYAPKTLFITATFSTHWKSHFSESLALFNLGGQKALLVGDFEYGAWNYVYECRTSLLIGKPLSEVMDKISIFKAEIQKNQQQVSLNHIEMLEQMVINLMQESNNPSCLIGDVYNEEKSLVDYYNIQDGFSLVTLHLYKLTLSFLFDLYEQAIENVEKSVDYLAAASAIDIAQFYLYSSLSYLALYTYVNAAQQNQYIQIVGANQAKMQEWAHHAPMNYLHKFQLVEAEKCRVLGQIQQAMDLYDLAIQGASENNYIQELALSNELAAKFYMSLGKKKIAKVYMGEAHYYYTKWGANTKVKHLEKRYSDLITYNQEIVNTNSTITTISAKTQTATSTSSHSELLDFATVIKVSEAIQSEINLENLPCTLLHIISENAGAQKGCLILEKNNHLYIEAIQNNQSKRISIPVESSEDVPISLINYVARIQDAIVINHATLEKICQNDPYIISQEPKSILCTPILTQRKLIGVLYLENNLTYNAFTPARLQLLKILTSQAAIAIKNARLYHRAQEKSNDLEQALLKLQQTQSQLVHTEKISSLGQMVAGVAHEVNNPVGFINGNLAHVNQYVDDLVNLLNLYQKHLPSPPAEIEEEIETIDLEYLLEDLPKMISSMKLGTTRIKEIMQSLRNFSRNDGDDKRAVDIHEGIEATLMILSHKLKAKPERPAIEIIKNYSDLPPVDCFPGQLNQVFMNLIANAIDALEETNQGKSYQQINNQITITTTAKNGWVTISIADNGMGMAEEIKQKLFNAFFTTKPEGKGTGLGLSISHKIVVEKHNGKLYCESLPGKGTKFIIEIPLG
ncbi:multi-sensor signal transduction multi-kinase [Calothrix sp. NIES-4071]|nr:multi-sensor signal transduction multi-kinase [Calothrix sp. NIES-4071]BAZ58818.1 multi-sensor signal transduction multi-kinase [Calothrix sp. NIES-4105]